MGRDRQAPPRPHRQRHQEPLELDAAQAGRPRAGRAAQEGGRRARRQQGQGGWQGPRRRRRHRQERQEAPHLGPDAQVGLLPRGLLPRDPRERRHQGRTRPRQARPQAHAHLPRGGLLIAREEEPRAGARHRRGARRRVGGGGARGGGGPALLPLDQRPRLRPGRVPLPPLPHLPPRRRPAPPRGRDAVWEQDLLLPPPQAQAVGAHHRGGRAPRLRGHPVDPRGQPRRLGGRHVWGDGDDAKHVWGHGVAADDGRGDLAAELHGGRGVHECAGEQGAGRNVCLGERGPRGDVGGRGGVDALHHAPSADGWSTTRAGVAVSPSFAAPQDGGARAAVVRGGASGWARLCPVGGWLGEELSDGAPMGRYPSPLKGGGGCESVPGGRKGATPVAAAEPKQTLW
mmetsp:Transcript_31164/g.72863  ORF Transcript_31164/g.72863 Transcript_31164/m.72863 type:complete len:400 (+) Transcript_31164:1157-2356(+)